MQDYSGLLDSIEKHTAERRAIEEARMQKEKDFLKHQQANLEAFLKDAVWTHSKLHVEQNVVLRLNSILYEGSQVYK